MKTSLKIIHYLNITIIISAIIFLAKGNSNSILFLLIPGISQPFLAFILLISRNKVKESIYEFIIWYWLGVVASIFTLPLYGFGIFIGIILIFFFGFGTYKFQKNHIEYSPSLIS